MMSRSLTFAFALDASSRDMRKVWAVFDLRIFFGSNPLLSRILRMAIRRLRTFSGFESLRYALIRLVRIFLVLAYFAAKDAFKVERRRLDGGEVSVDSLLKVNMDFGYGSIPVDPDESVFLGQGCELSCAQAGQQSPQRRRVRGSSSLRVASVWLAESLL